MAAGAKTPEELDTLLEDAFVLRDRESVVALFDEAAVLVESGGLEARGTEDIVRAVAQLSARDRTYVARPARVLQAHGSALVLSDAGVHVLRRGGDGLWRATISFLDLETSTTREDS
jgi:uncharacterized protein DUF4440